MPIERIGKFVEWHDTPTHTQEVFRDPEGRITRVNTLTREGKVLESRVVGYDAEGRLGWLWSDWFEKEVLLECSYQEVDGRQIALEVTYFKNAEGEWEVNHGGVAADVIVPNQRGVTPEFTFTERTDKPGWIENMPKVLDAWSLPYNANRDGDSIGASFFHGDSFVDAVGKTTYYKSMVDAPLQQRAWDKRPPIHPAILPISATPRPTTVAKVQGIKQYT